MRLIIDPGHGGRDTGAYHNGYTEKDLNLVIAKRLQYLLKEYNPALTRSSDINLVWNERTALIKNKYDICLSVHLNALNGTARGVETIHSHFSSKGKEIATAIMEAIHSGADVPKRSRPVYSRTNASGGDYYYMHRLTGNTTTVIIEGLFIDNDPDKLLLNVEKLAQSIARGFKNYMGKLKPDLVPSNARTLRRFSSNVHVYEAGKGTEVSFSLGKRWQLESVIKMVGDKLRAGEDILVATNAGFFNFDGSSEHLGLFIVDGLWYSSPSKDFVDFIFYKNGTTEVKNMHGYNQKELSRLQNEAHWAVGTSYALMIDGKVNLLNTDKFAHSKQKHPRTMLGQRKDGTFLLVVVDGRRLASAGVTAKEQAEIMKELKCHNALNFDGGGSSIMVAVENGKVVTKSVPTENRSVGSMIYVRRKK